MKLNELNPKDEAHWTLHLDALRKDNLGIGQPADLANVTTTDRYLKSLDDLPNLTHPSDIHDWVEEPDQRREVRLG